MNTTLELIASDFSRYTRLHKHVSVLLFIAIFFHNPGMLFSIIYRLEHQLLLSKKLSVRIIGLILQPIYFIITYYFLDIDVDPTINIGIGLYVHNRGIIISSTASLGHHCTIIGPTTIGMNLNGHKAPSLKNYVTICTGARIIGNILIGNNVIVGANAVVVNTVEPDVVVGGIPAVVLKKNTAIRSW